MRGEQKLKLRKKSLLGRGRRFGVDEAWVHSLWEFWIELISTSDDLDHMEACFFGAQGFLTTIRRFDFIDKKEYEASSSQLEALFALHSKVIHRGVLQ